MIYDRAFEPGSPLYLITLASDAHKRVIRVYGGLHTCQARARAEIRWFLSRSHPGEKFVVVEG